MQSRIPVRSWAVQQSWCSSCESQNSGGAVVNCDGAAVTGSDRLGDVVGWECGAGVGAGVGSDVAGAGVGDDVGSEVAGVAGAGVGAGVVAVSGSTPSSGSPFR